MQISILFRLNKAMFRVQQHLVQFMQDNHGPCVSDSEESERNDDAEPPSAEPPSETAAPAPGQDSTPTTAPQRRSKSNKEKWEHSAARKLLMEALISGEVSVESTETSKPRHVYAEFVVGKPAFQISDFADKKKFASRLRGLRKIVKTKQGKAGTDDSVLADTRKKYPKKTEDVHGQGRPLFKGSLADTLLKQDITNGVHKTMKPKALWLSKSEYQEALSLEQFRKKIHQEIYNRKAVIGMRKAELYEKYGLRFAGDKTN